MTERDRIADLLTFYFRTVYRAAGLTWDSDNDSEMQQLANAIDALAYANAVHVVSDQVNPRSLV